MHQMLLHKSWSHETHRHSQETIDGQESKEVRTSNESKAQARAVDQSPRERTADAFESKDCGQQDIKSDETHRRRTAHESPSSRYSIGAPPLAGTGDGDGKTAGILIPRSCYRHSSPAQWIATTSIDNWKCVLIVHYKDFWITTHQSGAGKWTATVRVVNDTDPSNVVETMDYLFEEYAVSEAKNICDGVVKNKPAPIARQSQA